MHDRPNRRDGWLKEQCVEGEGSVDIGWWDGSSLLCSLSLEAVTRKREERQRSVGDNMAASVKGTR